MQDGDAFLEDARADTHESDGHDASVTYLPKDLENETQENAESSLDGAPASFSLPAAAQTKVFLRNGCSRRNSS